MAPLAANSRVLLICEDNFELITLAASLRLNGVNVVGEAANSLLAENLFTSLRPEIVLVELQITGEETIAVLQRFRRINPELGIALLTACPDLRLHGLATREIPTGTQIIFKRSIADLSVITTALAKCISGASTKAPAEWVNHHDVIHENSIIHLLNEFTDVQIETMRLVAQGLSNSEVAKVRYVSEKSVEQIVARVAQTIGIAPDRSRNLRVVLTGEYFKWLGATRR